jgi:tRNA wybutosine-synthesizing protein 1
MVRKNPKRKACGSDVKDKLRKMNYALVGGTSAVQVCRWTKNAIRGDRGCWKEKFYGVSSAGCCQMTPAVMWCENQCLHCWRPIELNLGTELPCVDDPVEILDEIVAERRKLLEGFRGREGIDVEKLERALEPSLYTMSLSGEATLYPRLGEMFKEIRLRGAVSFLVTNGLNPSVLRNLETLPTQLTISMNAPNENLFKIWHRSSVKDAWGLFNESLDVMSLLKGKVRRVVRMTLVDVGEEGKFNETTNMSKENVGEYCDLIRKAEPDFVHVKGYKSVGYARGRMGYDNQPWFDAVKDYALKICDRLDGYEIAAEDERCCVVVLKKKGGIGLRIEKC